MARGFRGVKDDLSELVRHLLDVACFFGPLLPLPTNYDSDPNSPNSISNYPNSMVNDLVEFGAGVKCGITRVSTSLKRKSEIIHSGINNNNIIRDEVLSFVKELVKFPESWIEFPVPVDNCFDMSWHQKDHIATVENLAPSLATLRESICPSFMPEESFWKIYFALMHPKLNKLESELLSTQEIMEEMRANLKKKMESRAALDLQAEVASSSMTEEKHVNLTSSSKDIKTQPKSTLQYIDRWFDAPLLKNNDKASTHVTDEDNNVTMRKSRNFSYEHLHINRKISSDSEASEWQAVSETSDFEFLDKY